MPRSLDELEDRLRLQETILSVSSLLVRLLDDCLDATIDEALARLGIALNVDRSYLFVFHDNLTLMDNTHEWCREGITPQIGELQGLECQSLPYWMDKMRAHLPVLVESVASLPDCAQAERREFERQEILSLLCLPMFDDEGSLHGFIGFDAVRQTMKWPDWEVTLLQMMAGTFAVALKRHNDRQALRESETRFQAVTENSRHGIVIVDTSSREILLANPAMLMMLGNPSRTLIGRKVEVLHPPSSKNRKRKELRWYRQQEFGQTEELCLRSDGSSFVAEVTSSPLLYHGRICRMGSFTDLSALRNLEIQLRHAQKLRTVGQLAGGVAHYFNNLLTTIQLSLELLLLRDELPSDLRHRLTSLHEVVQHGSRLPARLLQFTAQQPMKTETVELTQILKLMIKLLHPLMGEEIEISLQESEGDHKVVADPSLIEQAVMEICVNARDSMPRGGTLSIAVESVRIDQFTRGVAPWIQPGTYIRLVLSDTGTGIEEEHLAHLFEPFYTTKEPGKGTGLGLAAVYGIMRQLEGWISVDTRIGHGTTFALHFPSAGNSFPAVPDLASP